MYWHRAVFSGMPEIDLNSYMRDTVKLLKCLEVVLFISFEITSVCVSITLEFQKDEY